MSPRVRRTRSTFVTVLTGAVVLSVFGTGTAVAGSLITSARIKNNTIKSIDVRDNSLQGADVLDGSISQADLGTVDADLLDGKDGSYYRVQKLTFEPVTFPPGSTWDDACFGGPAGAAVMNGVVYLRGDVCGASTTPAAEFVLPPAARPDRSVFVPVDQASGATGRLVIQPDGQVHVQDDPMGYSTASKLDASSPAAVFTSLSGVSYALP